MTTQAETNDRNPDALSQAAQLRSVDEEARTVEVVFSTGDLCIHWVRHNDTIQRMQTRVVLKKSAADLSLLKAGAPVLDSHYAYSSRSVLGVVEDAWLEEGKAVARLRFSQAEDVEPIWQRVREGTLRAVSMGFRPLAQKLSKEGETEVMLFTKWQAFEISTAPIGADRGARTQSTRDDGAIEATGADAAQEATQTDAAAAAHEGQGETQMADKKTAAPAAPAASPAAAITQTPAPLAPAATPEPTVDADAVRQAEQTRIAEINQVGAQLKVADTLVQAAIKDNTTVDEFRKVSLDAFAQAGQTAAGAGEIGGPRADVIEDAGDKFRQGAMIGQMARMGMKDGERNEFSGYTLMELARQSLVIRNVTPDSNRMQMVGQAFTQAGAHTTSDFANVLANIMNKAALRGWEEAEETYQLWTSSGVLSDFKPTKRVGLGLLDSLPEVAEGANYSYGTVGDRGENIVLATYGRLMKITRQAIINDDLNLFSTLPMKAGRAARRTIGGLVYGVLTGNPNMSDGVALFDAGHNNLAGSAGAPSVATLTAARTAMRTQKEKAGGPALNITPKYILLPAALETSTVQLLNSVVDPQVNKGHAVNPVAGMATPIVDARLDDDSATAWYMAADQNAFDTIEVAYLDGVQEPYLEEKTGWSSDGVELKVRIDAGVAPLEHRTLYKNAGA